MLRPHAPNYSRHATDRRDEARGTGLDGARAALETFYYGFHQMSIETIDQVIALDDECTVYHPIGTTARGHGAIVQLYQTMFRNPASIWVHLSEVIEYSSPDDLLFVGHEHGELTSGGTVAALSIRTTRLFHYYGAELGWRQVHHHGSVDNPTQFEAYRLALRS